MIQVYKTDTMQLQWNELEKMNLDASIQPHNNSYIFFHNGLSMILVSMLRSYNVKDGDIIEIDGYCLNLKIEVSPLFSLMLVMASTSARYLGQMVS